jgi:hypothetical protein
MKTYIAYDLSRNKFMTRKHKRRIARKAVEERSWYESPRGYIKRVSNSRRAGSRTGYVKNLCNRKLRRRPITDTNDNYGTYRKMYEYAWEVD